jgi:hypothetical protein
MLIPMTADKYETSLGYPNYYFELCVFQIADERIVVVLIYYLFR